MSPNGTKRPARVFLVDDHSVVREGLTSMLEKKGGFTVCGEAADGPTALELIPKAKPDIAIVDIGLQGMNGLELIKNLQKRAPRVAVLAMSMYEESVYAERALRAGARGYIMKHESVSNVVTALQRILSGKIYLSEKSSESILESLGGDKSAQRGSPVDVLSDRELEIFRLLGRGFKNKQIADELSLSVKTVESYHDQIKQKLKFKDSSELLQFAIQWIHSEQSFH